MPQELTHRLTSSDAAFLYLERRNAPLHIGSLGVYEGRVPFERFVEHIDARIPSIPRYRQRVAFVPLSLAHPTWEDDPSFDVRNHIHHVRLPQPGTEDQLRALTAELFAPPLDRNRPLWEMYVIEGLEGDRTGIVSKVHHCMVDGVSGIELLLATVDITPEPAPPPDAPPWQPKPGPTVAEQLTGAAVEQIRQQSELARFWLEGFLSPQARLREAGDFLRALADAAPMLQQPAPRLPFSASLSPERRIAFSEMSFVEIREIRTALGGTVNDVVLAIVTGALRRYCAHKGLSVNGDEPRVAIPVSVRLKDESGALGNRISSMLTTLPIGEPDAGEQLKVIQERTGQLKQDNQAGSLELLSRMSALIPAPVQALAGALPPFNPLINFICTNVPGPMIPLYTVGHRLEAHYPLVPLAMDMGLGVGVMSYNHMLYFGLMADAQSVPDVEQLGRFVDEAFLDLREAAGVLPSDHPTIETPQKYETTLATTAQGR